MNVNRFIPAFLLLWLATSVRLPAQTATNMPTATPTFSEIRARADKGGAAAQLELGEYYASNREMSKAVKSFRKAADQGLARAQFLLGLAYSNGKGVHADQVEAVKWFRKAADQKLPEAQVGLGQAFTEGDGVKENAAEGAKWFRLAAEQDDPAGEYELGKCYLQGRGTPKDLTEGVRWTRRSAEQGYALAQNSLGLCYANGVGLGKDNLQAYKWFNLAAAGDDEHADDTKVSLGLVERFLAPEQITEAQRLAREFKPRARGGSLASGSSTNGAAGLTHAAVSNGTDADPGSGVVIVHANDETCEIYLDGSFVGNAPARLKLTAGSHVLEVKKEGYTDSRKEIMVSAGSELTLRAKLEKKP